MYCPKCKEIIIRKQSGGRRPDKTHSNDRAYDEIPYLETCKCGSKESVMCPWLLSDVFSTPAPKKK